MKRIVVWTVALLVVLVAADFVVASAAEYQVSSRLKDQWSLPVEPAVRIAGFPVLTQARLGEYRKVDVAADYVGRGSMHNVGEFAELYHLHVPLSEVLTGSVSNVAVDSVASSVVITKEDLVKLLGGVSKLAVSPVTDATLDDATINANTALPGSSVTGMDPAEAVLISGDMSMRGHTTRVSVIASMTLADGQIEITPRDIRLAGTDPAQLLPQTQVALRAAFSLTINPGTLPFSLTPTRLRAVGDGIAISGTGKNITIDPSSQRTDSVNCQPTGARELPNGPCPTFPVIVIDQSQPRAEHPACRSALEPDVQDGRCVSPGLTVEMRPGKIVRLKPWRATRREATTARLGHLFSPVPLRR